MSLIADEDGRPSHTRVFLVSLIAGVGWVIAAALRAWAFGLSHDFASAMGIGVIAGGIVFIVFFVVLEIGLLLRGSGPREVGPTDARPLEPGHRAQGGGRRHRDRSTRTPCSAINTPGDK